MRTVRASPGVYENSKSITGVYETVRASPGMYENSRSIAGE